MSFLSNMKSKMPKVPKVPKLKRASKPVEEDAETEHDITPPVAEASRASQVMDEEAMEEIDFTDAAHSSSPAVSSIQIPQPQYDPPPPTVIVPKSKEERRPIVLRSKPATTGGMASRFGVLGELFDSIFPPPPTVWDLERQEQEQEIEAQRQFKQNLVRYRNTYTAYYSAPGYDYVNWKPYGTYRSHNNPREFHDQASALSDYVYAVVVSGCIGAEEKRWVTLTTSPEQHSAYMEASRAASRSASKEHL